MGLPHDPDFKEDPMKKAPEPTVVDAAQKKDMLAYSKGNSLQKDPFFCVPVAKHQTSMGEVVLPMMIYDATFAMAIFLCDLDKVEKVFEGTGMVPSFRLGGKGVVGLGLIEYRATSLGPYNEVGLALPQFWSKSNTVTDCVKSVLELYRSTKTKEMGYYVAHLPVTTELARVVGYECWGFPKFVTNIHININKRDMDCGVMDPKGKDSIFTIKGRLGPGVPAPALDILDNTIKDGKPLRTVVNTRGLARLYMGGNAVVSLGRSEHPMARTMRALGLDSKKPFCTHIVPKFQSLLHAGGAY